MIGSELPAHEIVVDRRTWPSATPLAFDQHRGDAVLVTQPRHPVLARYDAAFSAEFIGDESVAERRIVGVDLTRSIDQVGV